MPTPHHPSAAVRRMLCKLGAGIHDARRRRRLPMGIVAERAFTSRTLFNESRRAILAWASASMPRCCRHSGYLRVSVKSPTLVATTSGKRSRPPSFPRACACAAPLQRVPMPDVEVHIDLDGEPRRVGLLRRNVVRRTETVTFEYDDGWLADDNRFSIEPALSF